MKTSKLPAASVSGARLAPKATTLLLALGIHILGFTANATAAPSDLDMAFGTDGHVIFEQSTEAETWDHVLGLPNGDILVAGRTGTGSSLRQYVVRLDQHGERVPSFGVEGQVTLYVNGYPGGNIGDLLSIPNGKVFVLISEGYTLNSVARSKITLIRLGADGSPDSTFGGDGAVEIDTLRSNISGASGMALTPDGKILLVGGTGGSVAVLRLTPEGYLDTSFSGDGMAKHALSSYYAGIAAMAVQSDGKIVVAGYTRSSVSEDTQNLMVCRVTTDGTLDTSFASGGKLVMNLHGGPDAANALCLRPNGKIVVAGYTSTQPGNIEDFDKSLFVGLDQNGTLDNSFGSGGIVEIDVSSGLMDRGVRAATLMQDGRIVATSTVFYSGGGTRFAAVRLMPTGATDSGFSPGGTVQIPGTEAPSGSDWAHDLARDASGGILVIGGADNPQGRGGMLVRLKGDPDSDGDGVVDASETNTGIYVSPFDTGSNPNNWDTDGDGLGDGDETYRYLTKPLVTDSDGDGFLDGYEVQTGKSPTDPLDKPALVAEARTAIEFSFPSAIGKTYRIEDSPDMDSWEMVEEGIAGNGGTITRFYSTRNKEKRFFRVEESP